MYVLVSKHIILELSLMHFSSGFLSIQEKIFVPGSYAGKYILGTGLFQNNNLSCFFSASLSFIPLLLLRGHDHDEDDDDRDGLEWSRKKQVISLFSPRFFCYMNRSKNSC